MRWLARVVKAVAHRIVTGARRGRHRPDRPSATRRAAREEPATRAPHFDAVYALRSVERTLAAESERMAGFETGGVLVGFIDSRRNAVVVTAASGPGPNAHHGPFSFNRDRAFCQAFLDRHASATGGVIDFVGEWHKHPEADPRPSGVDVDTYRRLARDSTAHIDRPVVIITGTVPAGAPPAGSLRPSWPFPKALASSPAARPARGGAAMGRVNGFPHERRGDRYVRANAFVFRADGYEPRAIRWLPDDAYDDLLRDPGVDLGQASETIEEPGG